MRREGVLIERGHINFLTMKRGGLLEGGGHNRGFAVDRGGHYRGFTVDRNQSFLVIVDID